MTKKEKVKEPKSKVVQVVMIICYTIMTSLFSIGSFWGRQGFKKLAGVVLILTIVVFLLHNLWYKSYCRGFTRVMRYN